MCAHLGIMFAVRFFLYFGCVGAEGAEGTYHSSLWRDSNSFSWSNAPWAVPIAAENSFDSVSCWEI